MQRHLLRLMDDVALVHRSAMVQQPGKQRSLSDSQEEALGLLMADGDRLPFLTLPTLQQLCLFQQHALDLTNQLITSYDAGHPTATCVACQDEQPQTLLLPCQHAVLCNDCAEEAEHCPWKQCGQRVEAVHKLVTTLPPSLLGQSNE